MITCTEDGGPLGGGISLPSSFLLSTGEQSLLLLLLGLWPVLVGQLEQLCGWRGKRTLQVNFKSPSSYSMDGLFYSISCNCISDLGGKVSMAVQIANILSHHLQNHVVTICLLRNTMALFCGQPCLEKSSRHNSWCQKLETYRSGGPEPEWTGWLQGEP